MPIAKLFMNGRSQAVRLPKEFRFKGDRVRIRRVPEGVLLEPVETDVRAWFDQLDAFRREAGPFMVDEGGRPVGREQPSWDEVPERAPLE
jgi:antitoxin VapB